MRLAVQEIEGVQVKRIMIGGQNLYCYLGLKQAPKKKDNVIELLSK